MPNGIFGCQNVEGREEVHEEYGSQGFTKHPMMHRTDAYNKNLSGPKRQQH